MGYEMELVEKVKKAGIIGAGGAGFPTHAKLAAQAEYILLNGAECEPLLRVDQQLMEFYGKEIVGGLYLASKSVGAKEAIIGIKVKHRKVIEILRENIRELDLQGHVSVKPIADVYPAGDEQVLVYELTGRVVPETGIPIMVGCVVINSETALNIFHGAQDEAVTMKYVTVAGDVPKPITVKVPVGTPLKQLLEYAQIKDFDKYAVIDGGPMMGPLLDNLDGYVTRKTKGLIVLEATHPLIQKKKVTMKSTQMLNKTACEQCRLCTDMCPRYLLGHSTQPHKMVRAMGYDLIPDKEKTIALTCCSCNLCEYFSCPAGIKPKMANTYYSNLLRQKGIKHEVKDKYEVRSNREYRLIPSKRLMARIGILKFEKPAPLIDGIAIAPEIVGISIKDFVGAPATPCVKVGDAVKEGQLIAETDENMLGTKVHSSINGVVEEVQDDKIIIRRS